MDHDGLAALVCCLLVVVSGCAVAPGGTGGSVTKSEPADGVRVTVAEVIDGDTIRIEYENGTTDTARLLGVDTPEVYGETTPEEFEGVPDTDAGRACLAEYAERASAYTRTRLRGETVTITFDATEPRRGYYDRLLVYVHHDGGSVNYALVERGLARVYDSAFERADAFYDAEERAMAAGRGVWVCRDGTPEPVADGGTARSATTSAITSATASGDGVVVSRIHADADGDDAENLNDEYVVITNRGDEPVDLSGWTLRDAAGFEYRVPAGTTLDAGASLSIHVGAGEDTASDLYWGRKRPTLNNDGETVTLRNETGAVVARGST